VESKVSCKHENKNSCGTKLSQEIQPANQGVLNYFLRNVKDKVKEDVLKMKFKDLLHITFGHTDLVLFKNTA
jgi:hypothetical protein